MRGIPIPFSTPTRRAAQKSCVRIRSARKRHRKRPGKMRGRASRRWRTQTGSRSTKRQTHRPEGRNSSFLLPPGESFSRTLGAACRRCGIPNGSVSRLRRTAGDCAAAERSPAADRQGDRRKAFHHAWRRPRPVQRVYCQLCRRRSDDSRNSRKLFKRRVYKGREVCKRRFGVHKFPFAADP